METFEHVWPPSRRAFVRWLMDPDPRLRLERVKLCDLLMGRVIRMRAAEVLEKAIVVESLLSKWDTATELDLFVTSELDHAAHLEQIAAAAERGLIRWGARIDRDYCAPEDDGE